MISQKIRENRLRLNMTQESLAEKLSVTKASVSKWELNQSYPDITLLPQIADIFDISIDELMDHKKSDESHEEIQYTVTLIEDRLKNAAIFPFGTVENRVKFPNIPSVRLSKYLTEDSDDGEWKYEIQIEFTFTDPVVIEMIQAALSKGEYKDIIEKHSVNGQNIEIYHLWVCHDEILRYRLGDNAALKKAMQILTEKGIDL